MQELNRLLKQHRQMSDMMKKLGRGKGGAMRQMMKGLMGKGGPSDADIAAAQAQMGAGGMPSLPPGQTPFGGTLPGLGGGGALPPGLSGFGKKK